MCGIIDQKVLPACPMSILFNPKSHASIDKAPGPMKATPAPITRQENGRIQAFVVNENEDITNG